MHSVKRILSWPRSSTVELDAIPRATLRVEARKARIAHLESQKLIPGGGRTMTHQGHVTALFTSHRREPASQRTSPVLSDKLLWLSPTLQPALCGLGGAGIRHPHRNFQTTLKIQPPSPPVTVSKQPVTTTTTPQQWHESLTAVATRELPSSSLFHFDGTDSSMPEGAPANDGRADTTPPRTGRGSSRPPVVSSVSFTSRSAEPPPSAVTAASSSPA